MQRQKQTSLPGFSFPASPSFGGSKQKGNPKTARTVDSKQALHIVMRSALATRERSFLLKARRIEDILSKQAARFNVRLYNVANAGNHLHLLLKFHSRRGLRGFIRASTGLIARLVLDAERGRAWRSSILKGFWGARPFSRI